MIEIQSIQDIDEGLEYSFEASFSKEEIESYAKLSGDFNPLHVNKDYAVEQGFQDQVAHGLLTSSLFSRLIGMHIPGDKALILESQLKFRKPVYPEESLIVHGKVNSVSEGTGTFELKTTLSNKIAEKKVTGKFTIKVV